MSAVPNSTSTNDTVTVTREQFNLLRLAAMQYSSTCKSYARDAVKLGRDDLAAVWTKDADEYLALYQEVRSK